MLRQAAIEPETHSVRFIALWARIADELLRKRTRLDCVMIRSPDLAVGELGSPR